MRFGGKKVEDRYAHYDQSVYTMLVDSLYASTASLLLGTVTVGFTALATALAVGQATVGLLAIAVVVTNVVRLLVVVAYARHAREKKIVASNKWEGRYAAASCLMSLALGAFDYAAVTMSSSPAVHLLVSTVTVAFISSISGRMAARPHLVLPQVILIASPLAAGLLMHHDPLTNSLAVLLLLNVLSTQGLVRSLNKTLFQAIDATQENSLLAKRLDERNSLFDEALLNTGHGLCVIDETGRCLAWNDVFVRLLAGDGPAAMETGKILSDVINEASSEGCIAPANSAAMLAALATAQQTGAPSQVTLSYDHGRTIELAFRRTEVGHVVAVIEDVTDRKAAEAKIERLAHYDQLTGLRNRTAFVAQCDRILPTLPRSGNRAALMSIDLDHFKQVNDSMGHPVGDALLTMVAERLQSAVRQSDVVARFGGDEFLVLQYPLDNPIEAENLARRLVETLSAPYDIDGQEVVVGASVGIAIAPEDGATTMEMIKHSDLALYKSKNMGRRTYSFFEDGMNDQAQNRRRVETDIRLAIERREFELHFQPIVKLAGGGIISCEALLRWNHPLRGMVGPSEFLSVAEETGVIGTLGEWVLAEACRHAASWPDDITVAVNLSPVQFRYRDLVGSVRRALEASGLPPRRLELEITESVLMQDVIDNRGTIGELIALGVSVSLDDFGTGHSSLSHLHSLSLSKVKLDRSFVQDVSSNPVSSAVVQSVTNIARAKGIQVVAEGIEAGDQADIVSALGCTLGQGFLFGRPVPSVEITALIARRAGAVAA